MDPPSTPRKHLTRDQNIRVQTLRDAGFKYKQIHEQLGFSYKQIQRACLASRPTPKKRSGRPPVLLEEQVDEIELFIISKRSRQLLSYEQLATGPFQKFNIGWQAIKNALERRGY